ncbi:MAG: hypothetical protein GXP08_00050 [Gammaproteobacteria bacterium]|nr:hypothetical protein [Gammaproteobacteria bacterium]
MVANEARLTGSALSGIIILLFCMSIILGFGLGIFAAATTLGVAWLVLCIYRPLLAFSILFLVFVLAYARLGLPLVSVEGPGNRGVIALGDLMWLGFTLTWVSKSFMHGTTIRLRTAYPVEIWFMLPFILMSTFLPIVGVLAGDWPYSYAIPGLRTLQWCSFAIMVYFLAQRYSTHVVVKRVIGVVLLVAIVHMAYGLVQLGYSLGLLDRVWIILDDVFTMLHKQSWFYYPRLTGLYVNPNSYGMSSAMVFLLVLAIYLARADVGRRALLGMGLAAALFGLLLTASRSAYLGITVAFLIWMIIGLSSKRLAVRGLVQSVKLFFAAALGLVVLWPVLPEVLRGRLMRFLEVFTGGGAAMDRNAQARVEEWQWLWELYVSDYPLGTWVPASYATGSGVDSFYVLTVIQGTPIFTLCWLIFLGASVSLGWGAWRRAESRQNAAIGLALAGFVGVMAGGGLALSAMLEPQLAVLLWVLIGVSLAVVDERGRCWGKEFYYTTCYQEKAHDSLFMDEKLT